MKTNLTRRRFLSHTGTTALGALFLSSTSCRSIAGQNGERFTMGLSQYSLRELFKSGSLDPLDYPLFAVDQFGINAIDYWEGGLPKEKLDDMAYLAKIRVRSEAAGTDLFLLMTGAVNGAAGANPDGNKKIIQAMKRAQALGARYLRVFLWVPGDDQEVAAKKATETLKPLSDIAARYNIKLVIEPGASKLTQHGEFLAKVSRAVDHPHCRLMPDFGKLRGDIYAGTQAMLPDSEVISCKMHSFDAAGNQPDFDYQRLMRMIADSDYSGILAIEWEGKKLKPVEGVKASQKLIQKSLKGLV